MDGCIPPVKPTQKKGNEKDMNNLGIDIGKRKYVEQRLKMAKERYLMNSSLVMIEMEYAFCFQEYNLMENRISCIISTIRKISKKLTIPNRNPQNKIKILQNIIENL